MLEHENTEGDLFDRVLAAMGGIEAVTEMLNTPYAKGAPHALLVRDPDGLVYVDPLCGNYDGQRVYWCDIEPDERDEIRRRLPDLFED